MMIELGQEVKDKVTGFKGIASGRCVYLSGCAHVSIQPKVGKDGKLPEAKWFDEPMIELVSKKKKKVVIKTRSRRFGGPMLTPASR